VRARALESQLQEHVQDHAADRAQQQEASFARPTRRAQQEQACRDQQRHRQCASGGRQKNHQPVERAAPAIDQLLRGGIERVKLIFV